MHIEILRTFCALVELGSFSRTAEKRYITQSAVSQQLAQLESAYKCRLLDRKKRPFGLTKAGELFYNAAKEMLERLDKLRVDLDSLQKSAAKRINIAAIFSIGMHGLPPYIKKFMAKYPDIHVHIEYLSSREIHERLLRGTVDIGLVAVPKKDRNIKMYEFEDEPLVLVCSPEHPLGARPQIAIRQLWLEKFIAFEKGIPTRTLIDGLLEEHHVPVQKVMEFDNIETIKRAVEINAGVSILPQTAIQTELANGTLKAVLLLGEGFVRPTGIIVRKEKVLSRPARYLIDLLTKSQDHKDGD